MRRYSVPGRRFKNHLFFLPLLNIRLLSALILLTVQQAGQHSPGNHFQLRYILIKSVASQVHIY